MKTILILIFAGLCTALYFVIAAAPRVYSEYVPGVGRVVWQAGSNRRWIVFPEESCR